MIFIRNGPRFLFVRTETRQAIERHAVERFGGVHYSFNDGLTDKVESGHLGPGMILLRVVGDGAPTLEELERRYAGVRADFEGAIEAGEAE